MGRGETVEVGVAIQGSDGVCYELAGFLTEFVMVGQLRRQILDKCSLPEIYGLGRRCVMSNHGGEANTVTFADLQGTEVAFDVAALGSSAVAHP